jgi:hypothetical protein
MPTLYLVVFVAALVKNEDNSCDDDAIEGKLREKKIPS